MIRKQSPRLCRGIERVGARQSCCTRQKRNKSRGREEERERGLGTAWLTGLGPLNICLEACTLWGFDCFGTRVEDRFNDRRTDPSAKVARSYLLWADSAALLFFWIFFHDYSDFLGIFSNPVQLFLRVSSEKEKLLFVSSSVSHDTDPRSNSKLLGLFLFNSYTSYD